MELDALNDTLGFAERKLGGVPWQVVDADGAVLGFRRDGRKVVAPTMPCNVLDCMTDGNLDGDVGEVRSDDRTAPFCGGFFLGFAVVC